MEIAVRMNFEKSVLIMLAVFCRRGFIDIDPFEACAHGASHKITHFAVHLLDEIVEILESLTRNRDTAADARLIFVEVIARTESSVFWSNAPAKAAWKRPSLLPILT